MRSFFFSPVIPCWPNGWPIHEKAPVAGIFRIAGITVGVLAFFAQRDLNSEKAILRRVGYALAGGLENGTGFEGANFFK